MSERWNDEAMNHQETMLMRTSEGPPPFSRRRFGLSLASVVMVVVQPGCVAKSKSTRRLRAIGHHPSFVVSQPLRSPRDQPTRGDDVRVFDGEWIAPMLPVARRAVERAGFRFHHRIEIRSHRDISSFVKATRQTRAQLRAWTTWKTIHLLSRAYWRDQDDATALARLTHELVHIAMFGGFGSEERARRAAVPFFWLEGAASVIANQQKSRMPLVVLRTRVPARVNPLRSTLLPLSVRYSAAHHCAKLLQTVIGPKVFATVSNVAAKEANAGTIDRALRAITGFDVDTLWRATRES